MMEPQGLYDVMIALADPTATPIWCAHAWPAFAAVLEGFWQGDTGSPQLRVYQVDPVARGSIDHDDLRWDPESFETWTHAQNGKDHRVFRSMTISHPADPTRGQLPSVFVNTIAPGKARQFRYAVLIALQPHHRLLA